jgi:hypothetical protein
LLTRSENYAEGAFTVGPKTFDFHGSNVESATGLLPILDADEPGGFGTFGVPWSPSRSEGKVFPKTNADLLIHNTMPQYDADFSWLE